MSYVGPFPCIVSDQVKTKANEVWNLIDTDIGGINTFSVALSPNGQLNPTGWACYTMLEQECVDALQPEVTNQQFDAFLAMRSAKLGRPVPANATSFRAQFKIGAQYQDPFAFVAQEGYQVIRKQK